MKRYEKYSSSYYETAFWNKIKTVSQRAGIKVIYVALLLYYVLISSSTPIIDKTKIVAVLGYFIFPIDMIPDYIPILGYTDDLTALMWAFNSVKNNITPEIIENAKSQLHQWFNDADEADLSFFQM